MAGAANNLVLNRFSVDRELWPPRSSSLRAEGEAIQGRLLGACGPGSPRFARDDGVAHVHTENVALVYLRRLDEKLDRMLVGIDDLKVRASAVELCRATLEMRVVTLNSRVDRVGQRLDRIERRLDLLDLPAQ